MENNFYIEVTKFTTLDKVKESGEKMLTLASFLSPFDSFSFFFFFLLVTN